MSTDHEKLIDEARAFSSQSFLGMSTARSLDRAIVLIRDLVAVFEKAHTPTDDEREAALDSERLRQIAEWLRMDLGQVETARRVELIADRHDHLAAGFRRTVQGEPPADERAARAELRRIVDIDDARRVLVSSADVRAVLDALQARTVQGEPSDAQVDAVAVAIAKAADADYWTDEIAEWENAEQWEREAYPDNYPSTAYEDREEFRKQARAALRAAGVVSVQDEPDWEYGVKHIAVDGWPNDEAHVSRADAESDLRSCGWNCKLIRRTPARDGAPAGPWVPVVDLPEGEEQ